jgi:hypothetical protein
MSSKQNIFVDESLREREREREMEKGHVAID